MNDLMQALQAGQITPSQYEMIMQKMQQMGISGRGIDTPSARDMVLDMVMNSSNVPEDVQQGLLGQGVQQMGQATTEPEWQPPKYEVPPPRPVDPMQGQQMMPEISGRGAPTQKETDFLTDFVNNRSSSIGSRGIDTPQERDYIQNIMQGYNKRY